MATKNISKTTRYVNRHLQGTTSAISFGGSGGASINLSNYYTKCDSDNRFLNLSGGTLTDDLTVKKNGITTLTLKDTSNTRADIDFNDNTATQGVLRYDFSDNKFKFFNNGSEQLTIDSAGNVSVNKFAVNRDTVESSFLLDVNGNAKVRGINQVQAIRTEVDNSDFNVISRSASGSALYVQQAVGGGNIAEFNSGNGNVNQGTTAMIIAGDNTYICNNLVFSDDSTDRGIKLYSDGTYFRVRKSDEATNPLYYYIMDDIEHFYVYTPNIWLGNTNGTTINIRGNNLTGDDFCLKANDGLKSDIVQSYSIPFSEGFEGQGYQLCKNLNNNYCLQLDDLKVRGNLSAYNYEIRKITALNGNFWVTNAVKATGGIDWFTSCSYGNYFTYELGDYYLESGDIIKSKTMSGYNIHSDEYKVTDTDTTNKRYYIEAIQATDRNDCAGSQGMTDYDVMSMINVNASTFHNANSETPYVGVDFSMSSGQAFKSNTFTIRGKGRVQVRMNRAGTGSGYLYYVVKDASGNDISVSDYIYLTSNSTKTDNILIQETNWTGGEAYIYYYAGASGVAANNFYVDVVDDYTIDSSVDVTGFEFVRINGSSIFLSSDEENAPFLDVYDNVTTSITQDNIKVRLGNLEGICFNDNQPLGGYGLYSDNVHLKGQIESDTGKIGNWCIDNNQIWSTGQTGQIQLKADDQSLTVYDSNNFIRGQIFNKSIPLISELTTGSDCCYWSIYAQSYTDISLQTTQKNQTQSCSIYLKENASSTNYLKCCATNSGYNIDGLSSNSSYQVSMKVNKKPSSYTLTAEQSLPTSPTLGEVATCTEVNIEGTFGYNTCVRLYDCNNNELANQYSSAPLRAATQLCDEFTSTVFNSNLIIPESEVYFKVDYQYVNNAYEKEITYWYEWTGDGWIPVSPFTTTTERSLTINHGFETEEVFFDATFQETNIGKDGLLSFWGSDKYFSINCAGSCYHYDNSFIQSSGAFHHKGKMYVSDCDESPFTTDDALFVSSCNSGYIATFYNDGNNYTHKGIRIRAGYDTQCYSTNDNVFINFEDGNGTTVGSILNDCQGLRIFSVSDATLKENIEEYNDSALTTLSTINPVKYNWKGDITKNKKKVIGYTTEQFKQAGLTVKCLNNEVESLDQSELIPYLHKAILELKSCVQKLENK